MLSGLSSAQHQWDLVSARADETVMGGDGWAASPYMVGEQIFDEQDRVTALHPVYVVPQHKIDDIKEHFMLKRGF